MRPLQQAMPSVVADLLRSGPMSPAKLAFAWRAVVGPAVDRATAVRLEDRALLVDSSSAQWARELRWSEALILARLQRLLGADVVTSIAVRTR